MSGKLEKHEQERGTFFCSVTHDLALAEEMIKGLPDFTSYAYIRHEPDTEEGTPHVHFLVRNNGTRSVKQIANKLGISPQYVQVCRKVVAFRRYMLHLDNDEKIKYSIDDIHTNRISDFKAAILGNSEGDVYDLFKSFRSLSCGEKTADEFIQENYAEMSRMAFSQKIKTFEIILKIEKSSLESRARTT
ncbi:hypothetical protein IJ118_03175 [Candidatus Saccharibacteria bacterium]|nr:hypothetical protein [Candidatus Saccharibacteria bacterium]